MIRQSRVVIVICPSLEDTVRAIEPRAQIVFDRKCAGVGRGRATVEDAAAVRRTFGLSNATPVVLYTGTFEAYQGLDLLFDAMAIVRQARPDAAAPAGGRACRSGVAGARAGARGRHRGRRHLCRRAARGGDSCVLLACDVLVSPRARGTNHAAQDLPVPALGKTESSPRGC